MSIGTPSLTNYTTCGSIRLGFTHFLLELGEKEGGQTLCQKHPIVESLNFLTIVKPLSFDWFSTHTTPMRLKHSVNLSFVPLEGNNVKHLHGIGVHPVELADPLLGVMGATILNTVRKVATGFCKAQTPIDKLIDR
jgi:hypothetical protein